MSEPDRYVQLLSGFGGQLDRDMLPERWRPTPDIDRDIENAPTQYTDQLGLSTRWNLEMEPAQRSCAPGARLVVLHEVARDAEVTQPLLAKCLAEPTAAVSKPLWHDDLRKAFQQSRTGTHASP